MRDKKPGIILKIIRLTYIVFMSIVVILFMIQRILVTEYTISDLYKLYVISYHFTYVFIYATAIVVILKSFLFFIKATKEKIIAGIGLLLAAVLLLYFSRHIIGFLFVLIYGVI